MTGGGGGVIIIKSLVASGQFAPTDSTDLQNIGDKLAPRCSLLDALKVARIVYRRLRQP